jgi:hypothetical protein
MFSHSWRINFINNTRMLESLHLIHRETKKRRPAEQCDYVLFVGPLPGGQLGTHGPAEEFM